ncbi:MAG TPA: radical SAM protein [Terriglobia bacterium]|nr:radical SAM protein [Terriglobia bacterium]
MKVSLVQPLHADHKVVKKGNGGVFKPAQLTMPYIAACTPPEWEVEIHDEIVNPLDVDQIDGEVVGITAVTPFAPRAYELARLFRARGQAVIMGGPHATALPEEVASVCDAAIVGEGDLLWPEALNDWKRGKLRKIYRNTRSVPLENLPRPRWDLLNPDHYIVPQVVQASRGCPFTCDFCSLRNVFPGYRTRPIKDVIREVEQIPYKDVVFWDDNIIGNTVWAKQLFRELKPLGKRWYSQATITIAASRELVQLAGKSGCAGLFVGLESFSTASLKETHKQFNKVTRYREDIKLLADNGIVVMSGLIFGFDEDTVDTFPRTLEGAIEIGLTGIACSILTPYPGTGLFERMRSQRRLTTFDWDHYSSDEVVFTPKNLTPQQIIQGHNWVGQQFHRYSNMVRRWWRTGLAQPKVFWLANLADRRYFNFFDKVAEPPRAQAQAA